MTEQIDFDMLQNEMVTTLRERNDLEEENQRLNAALEETDARYQYHLERDVEQVQKIARLKDVLQHVAAEMGYGLHDVEAWNTLRDEVRGAIAAERDEYQASALYFHQQTEVLEANNKALLAIVEKLPRTADGARVCIDDDPVWFNPNDAGWMCTTQLFNSSTPEISAQIVSYRRVVFEPTEWKLSLNPGCTFWWNGPVYSTREAAEAALAAKGKKL